MTILINVDCKVDSRKSRKYSRKTKIVLLTIQCNKFDGGLIKA